MADAISWVRTSFSSPGAAILSRRCRRIWLLMIAVWIMNGFDLAFTLHAYQQGLLIEANPIAHAVLPHGPLALAAFKIFLVAFGSYVVLSNHRRFFVECMAWFLVAVYFCVSLHWMVCYEAYELIAANQFQLPISTPALG